MRIGWVPVLLVLALGAVGQDDISYNCPKFNRCKKKSGKEKVKCPSCERRKIYKDYALCTGCARKGKLCSRCGRPRTGGGKPGVISADNVKKYLSHLASDALEGRGAGKAGAKKAAEYIRDHVKRWGLKAGNGGDYFQEFKIRGGETDNVIAVLEGTTLKNEYVIVGGHYDHLGVSKRKKQGGDSIFNGADDNASGTATLMEIARVLGQGGKPLKRTLVFIWFGAEELGLLGSKHYCKDPVFPLDKTVAMVCMEMVGRNPEKPVDIKGLASAKGWREIVEAAARTAKLDANFMDAASGATDYHTFLDRGIPSIDFHSNKHSDYHKLGDEADKIDYAQCAAVGTAARKVLIELCNREGRLEFKKPSRR